MGFGETVFARPVTALGHLMVALERYNQDRQARLSQGFEDDVFPLMPFVLQAGELLPWGTGEAIPDTAWVEFWMEIPPGVTNSSSAELRPRWWTDDRGTPPLGESPPVGKSGRVSWPAAPSRRTTPILARWPAILPR